MSEKPVKTDLTLKMTQQVFDDLAAKKYGGVYGVIFGKISVQGSINTLKNFDNLVVKTYFDENLLPLPVPKNA